MTPATAIPRAALSLGVAPVDIPADEVVYDIPAGLEAGAFQAVVDGQSLRGEQRVWARACLGAVCGDPVLTGP